MSQKETYTKKELVSIIEDLIWSIAEIHAYGRIEEEDLQREYKKERIVYTKLMKTKKEEE